MTDAAKKARAEYQREWRRKNPDKVREIRERHWEKVAAEAAKREATQNGKGSDSKQS